MTDALERNENGSIKTDLAAAKKRALDFSPDECFSDFIDILEKNKKTPQKKTGIVCVRKSGRMRSPLPLNDGLFALLTAARYAVLTACVSYDVLTASRIL